jgi:hypothetical protein
MLAMPAEAAKPAKILRISECRAASAVVTREHGVTVYRATPRSWKQETARAETATPAPRVIIRANRYNYLSVDTRTRGEWGPMYAVYQKF